MIDFARIKVIAGNGGRGAGSFVHIKGKRRGKADGGDGGSGGDVYLVASPHLNTLEPFRFVKEYKAADGGSGTPNRRKGADAQDLEIKAPVGTQVRIFSGPVTSFLPASARSDLKSHDKKKDNPDLRAVGNPPSGATRKLEEIDLVEVNQKVLLARGGEYGRGNAHLRDELGRRPFGGQAGQEGEVVEVELELKLIADVGLVGLPNAGKSTLISALTSARPKIAPYPFTTLEPNLGVLDLDYALRVGHSLSRGQRSVGDLHKAGLAPNSEATSSRATSPRIILADIPGLIEGASEGKGLGDLFLRHIERTKIILHLVDVTSEDIWKDYQTIRGELRAYSKDLAKKKEIIVLNKVDLVLEDYIKVQIDVFKKHRKKVFLISAVNKQGLSELTKGIVGKLS